MVIENKIAKTEMVYELKEEYKVPSFEEFVKTYENDDKIIDSYQVENEAKITHGPQYGPGKSDFSGLCRRIKNNLDSNITCRITCDSDNFYSWKSYAGVIVYAVDGSFRWQFSCGSCGGMHNGRPLSIFIKSADDSESPGIGGFHASIIKDKFGIDLSYNNNRVCCGGFAWRDGMLRFNSYALNSVDQIGGSSDGSRELSYYEKRLVEYCFDKYKQLGPDSVFEIPSYCLP